MKKVSFFNLKKSFEVYEKEINDSLIRVCSSGWYLLGKELDQFENNFSKYCGTKYCIGVGSGLDALIIILRSYKELGILKDKDEIIVPANTYIATILAIIECGLKPVFVEPDLETYNIDPYKFEKSITKHTKGIIVVHLYGPLAQMDKIIEISSKYNLITIEDSAQAHGAKNKKGFYSGSFGDASGFSFYPSKNLGSYGDAGAIVTNNKNIAHISRSIRNYGSEKKILQFI